MMGTTTHKMNSESEKKSYQWKKGSQSFMFISFSEVGTPSRYKQGFWRQVTWVQTPVPSFARPLILSKFSGPQFPHNKVKIKNGIHLMSVVRI